MERIGLIDLGGKIPNLALMRLSTFHKNRGDKVLFGEFDRGQVDHVYVSVLFEKDREEAKSLQQLFPSITLGGVGWDKTVKLAPEVEACPPDYTLYTADMLLKRLKGGISTKEKKLEKATELVDAAIGYSTRGCVRRCSFCVVPQAEGKLHQVADIATLLRPDSRHLTLLDNNFCADPLAYEKLAVLRERKIVVDICQGLDMRLMTPELAEALGTVRHWRSIHTAWDLAESETSILRGLGYLMDHFGKKRIMVYMLVGYNTTWEEDMHRFRTLEGLGVSPYIMPYNRNEAGDPRIRHFARWVNGRFYPAVHNFDDYEPWAKARREQPVAGDLFAERAA